ncbi:hypothetical protein GCM10018785_42240 [Streptomyces longispororuber]|uniref:Uncharacterized protein n=1 Tax=Streptomyces longispororuber TaxID=68230 RepID=A0A918ZTH8_9ACTN|nr:hypothetical protein GCM10018785_42240 [Streptomyces longispororuber]
MAPYCVRSVSLAGDEDTEHRSAQQSDGADYQGDGGERFVLANIAMRARIGPPSSKTIGRKRSPIVLRTITMMLRTFSPAPFLAGAWCRPTNWLPYCVVVSRSFAWVAPRSGLTATGLKLGRMNIRRYKAG